MLRPGFCRRFGDLQRSLLPSTFFVAREASRAAYKLRAWMSSLTSTTGSLPWTR